MLKDSEIERIAHLARLELSPEACIATRQKLDTILTLIDQLEAIPTAGVEPLTHIQDVAQPLRADCVTENDQSDVFQRLAPATAAGLYLVPKVIE
jgi:aspartyl-tRNA(Asn)/glutamyl-tRNA(Gln) amidotransferase subunit C